MRIHLFGLPIERVAVALALCVPLVAGQGCPSYALPGMPDGLMARAGPDGRVVPGQKFRLQGGASMGTGDYTYSWTPTTGLDSTTAAQPVFTATAPGIFRFTLTVTDSNGDVATDTITIRVTTDSSDSSEQESDGTIRCGRGPCN